MVDQQALSHGSATGIEHFQPPAWEALFQFFPGQRRALIGAAEARREANIQYVLASLQQEA